jgi:hypothetical protein
MTEYVMNKPALTGKTRHRIDRRIFGSDKIILQVEERCTGFESDDYFNSPPNDVDYLRWRDALPEDLIELKEVCQKS